MVGSDYRPGAFWGENEFLGFSDEHTESLRARTFVEISSLHLESMKPIFARHLSLRRRFEKYARLKKQLTSRLQELQKGEFGDEVTEEEFVSQLRAIKAQIEDATLQEGGLVEARFKDFANSQGMINMDGVAKLAEAMGYTLKLWELREAMSAMDTDGSGTVNMEEFQHWWDMNGEHCRSSTSDRHAPSPTDATR
eukprot:COSAG05_NODE_2319_length_3240_cov_3.126393_2_plen_195_part_00